MIYKDSLVDEINLNFELKNQKCKINNIERMRANSSQENELTIDKDELGS